MSYYDPTKWIAADDQLLSDIETKLKLEKRSSSKRAKYGRSFLPRTCLELDVNVDVTHELLRLTEWIDQTGKVYIELGYSEDMYRKGHFNTDEWHHNPNGANIPPPHHMHFPTVTYPNLKRKPNYAHPIKANNDYIDYINALKRFCAFVNITLRGVALPLLRR